MIPPIVRLPETQLDHGSLGDLARCVDLVADGRTVLIGTQRAASGDVLDEFVVATSLARRGGDAAVGIAARVGAARAASMVAREATTAELLGACDVLLLEGEASTCRDAALVVAALFTEGAHTVTTPTAIVVGARNLPLPGVAAGPPVCWREGSVLRQLDDGEVADAGHVVDLAAGSPLPVPEPGVLVVVGHPLGTPGALAAVLER